MLVGQIVIPMQPCRCVSIAGRQLGELCNSVEQPNIAAQIGQSIVVRLLLIVPLRNFAQARLSLRVGESGIHGFEIALDLNFLQKPFWPDGITTCIWKDTFPTSGDLDPLMNG